MGRDPTVSLRATASQTTETPSALPAPVLLTPPVPCTSSTSRRRSIRTADMAKTAAPAPRGKKDGPPPVFIRELPIAHPDDPFGDRPEEDTTGLGIWCASLAMARWVSSIDVRNRILEGRRVLELGSGCGVPGLAAAVGGGGPASVTLTDLNPATLRNLAHNIGLNAGSVGETDVTESPIDWGDRSTWPEEGDRPDVILGSDLIYQSSVVPLLMEAVTGLLRPGGIFLYVCPDTGRDGLPEFLNAMREDGFNLASQRVAPDSYRSNPLRNGDDEECFLHFHELASTTYVLYEFRRS